MINWISKWMIGGLISLSWFCGTVFGTDLDAEIKRLEVFSEVYHLIGDSYIEPIGNDALIQTAIEGMVARLDDYSGILREDEMALLESTSIGRMVGIGMNVQELNGVYTVTKVRPNTPAGRSGLRTGDVIVSLEGQPIKDLNDSQLARLIRGEVGTQLHLVFYHPDSPDTLFDRSIKREEISIQSVDGFEVGGNTLVIQVHEFQKKTPEEIREWLSHKSYNSVVLDLRDNFGGLFLSGVETAELFLPIGPIMETRDQKGQVIEKYVSRASRDIRESTLVVLINRYSASSAEIVAAAIKERGQGILIGETSFGKGVAQTVFSVGDGLYLKLTTSKFYMPSGESYHQIGVHPDIRIDDNADSVRYGASDMIYQKALEIIINQAAIK